MKAMNVCLAVMAIALAACSGNKKSHLGEWPVVEHLGDLPVVAHQVEVNGQEMAVCELDLLKDTVNLPLSYWVEDLEVVKLDAKDEALVGLGGVVISDNYILVGRANNVPCKLFRRDGSYVSSVGSIGQGPGEYTMVYDMQIDEQAEHVYLLPWNAKSIPMLSEKDINFCCLVKTNMSIQSLTDIYCISKNSVSRKKLRLKEKMEIGEGETLDEFLNRLG